MELRRPTPGGLPIRSILLAAAVSAAVVLLLGFAGEARAGGQVVLENESFVCTGPVDLDLVKVTMREYRGGGGGPGVDAIVIDPGCTGRIGQIQVDTWVADGVKIRPRAVRPGAEEAHDVVIESGYIRCHDIAGSIHQDAVQAGGGERITFRKVALDCLGNSNFYASGWNGSQTSQLVCEGCALGPNAGSTLFTNERSERSGARNSLVCEGRFSRLTFRLESSTSVNDGNRRGADGDARCTWQRLLDQVDFKGVAVTGSGGQTTAQVEASLVNARVIRNASGGRAVRVELEVDERLSVRLRLARSGATLASRTQAVTPSTGTRVVRLAIGNPVASGKATLTVTVTDGDGNKRTFRRKLTIPA